MRADSEERQDVSTDRSSRRRFMQEAAAVAAFTIVPRHVLGGAGHTPPSEKLNIAGIGIGGRGEGDLDEVGTENIVALCDVDEAYAGRVFKKYPNARKWTDFRKMLDEQKDIDAVVIATPDHLHAVVAMAAIKRGKHVYCEKPLAHSIWECRQLAEAAREAKVATQLGNQGQASESNRLVSEIIWDGAIGTVREVHAWCNRPISPRGIERPKDTPPVPATLDWDLWLGPAKSRPYHPCYLPFSWRGWWDFGTGVLGDIGCHQLDPVFRALKLGYPTAVEACSSNMDEGPGVKEETAPKASIVRFEFPAREGFPPLALTWYDGGLMPQRPVELEEGRKFGEADDNLFVGDKGKMLGYRLIPEARMKEYGKPPQRIERSPGHHKEWLIACKGGPAARASFDWAGPLTEVVLYGNIALRMERQLYEKGLKLHCDGPNMRITNLPEANRYIRDEYRDGWTL
ncbi:MAG: Gfo/Idh/MocA family oxidoreductase [Sedimentisphaerales bacterium]|jgi:predicted dehydrogenase|nr:Gfo/Idh/MocA family oxidoreductase [Sedimentisphaerales bacterium]HNY77052.1 Gfo/Idh/MocA family oxidoreductase [Sedimentisphaerales bacterium]HOC62533.1 Gfo/Idh/MocA family oxidoreductase [Sedimentisphaerales bacterium]HOH63051.1 Gfo/Idh/MocA family oxidoreductase [Sedimentisphaerales bacterium]HPY51802.1 Gfo/Idh/MocA family oxidoreductase [Sedimentisphaerales bacterium]